MFTVWVDNECIYSPNIIDDDYRIMDPVLTEELNKAGSFTFTLPPTNRMYSQIHKMTSDIVIKQDDQDIWWGRVTDEKRDYYKRKHVNCEGILGFLMDSVVRPYDYEGDLPPLLQQYISRHNAKVESNKQFTIGTVTVTDSNNYVAYSSTVFPKTLDEINEKLVKTHGGYLFARRSNNVNYLDYLASSGSNSDQVIEFGKNLIDLEEVIDARDVVTVLIPLGKDRLTITSVNGGLDRIESSTGISLFGKIEGTNEWKDVTNATNLKNKGQTWLNNHIQESVSLTVNAVDYNLIDSDVDAIKLGQYVRIVSVPHNLDTYLPCSKKVTHLQDPTKGSFTLGKTYKTLTDRQSEILKGIRINE